MTTSSSKRRSSRRATLAGAILACAAWAFAVASPGALAAGTTYSTNWAGYVARSPRAGGSRFETVSGSWTQPAAACTAARQTYSAVWIGLGGYRSGSRALEQIGTDANCSRAGRASYSSWFELVPAGPAGLGLAVHPGDRMGASVTVIGRDATLRLRDLTSGAYTSTTRRLARVDVSSAEWIVEAPSLCRTATSCETLALTDFGAVSFQRASATSSAGHVGTIADRSWSATRIVLRQSAFAPGEASAAGSAADGALILATPSVSASSAFSVAYSQQSGGAGEEGGAGAPSGPTLPGFSGGSS